VSSKKLFDHTNDDKYNELNRSDIRVI